MSSFLNQCIYQNFVNRLKIFNIDLVYINPINAPSNEAEKCISRIINTLVQHSLITDLSSCRIKSFIILIRQVSESAPSSALTSCCTIISQTSSFSIYKPDRGRESLSNHASSQPIPFRRPSHVAFFALDIIFSHTFPTFVQPLSNITTSNPDRISKRVHV